MIREVKSTEALCSQQFSTDEELVAGLMTQQELAFECIYRRHFPVLKNFILQNRGTEEDAKDIFQEGVIALWTNLQKGSYQLRKEAKLSTYLLKICKYRWYERLKSARVKHNIPLTEFVEVAEEKNILDQLVASEDVRYLSHLFQRLGDKCRHILRSFYYEKKSLEEIAHSLGHQPKSLKTEKYRCMQKLKKFHQKTGQ